MDLYRGKAKMTGDWIIGAAVCIGEKAYILGTESLFPERPAYYRMAMGCGIEDRGLQNDGYQAAEYGWEEALERYEENFPKWIELEPKTVTRCCDRHDVRGNVLFEGDIFKNPAGTLYEICYGRYYVFDPQEQAYFESVGFFKVSQDKNRPKGKYGFKDINALGTPESYAYLVGNIFDNPELRQLHVKEERQDAAQPLLTPAT